MAASVEVFRDLYLRGSPARRSELREALIAAAEHPWYYDPERLAAIGRLEPGADIMAFGRKETDGIRAAGLTLWSSDDGYYVPNIVPIDHGELGVRQYNKILADFITRVVDRVAPRFDYRVDATEASQDLEDWMTADAARKLRLFSAVAVKSSCPSHPLDQRRWFDFIIAVHASGRVIGADYLVRWLSGSEGWDEQTSHELAGRYETALALLKRYDEN